MALPIPAVALEYELVGDAMLRFDESCWQSSEVKLLGDDAAFGTIDMPRREPVAIGAPAPALDDGCKFRRLQFEPPISIIAATSTHANPTVMNIAIPNRWPNHCM